MWFTGMRGAVAFALALHMEVDSKETKMVTWLGLDTGLCSIANHVPL